MKDDPKYCQKLIATRAEVNRNSSYKMKLIMLIIGKHLVYTFQIDMVEIKDVYQDFDGETIEEDIMKYYNHDHLQNMLVALVKGL